MRTELTLDQMLSDTIVQLVMRRDGITEHCVRAVWDSLRRARGGRGATDGGRRLDRLNAAPATDRRRISRV